MAVELELVSAILEAGNLTAVRDGNITPEKLSGSPEAKLLLETILAYSENPIHAGNVPTPAWLSKKHPQIVLPPTDMEIMELVEAVDRTFRTRRLNTLLKSASRVATEKGINECIQFLASESVKMLSEGGRNDDIAIETVMKDIVSSEYEKNKSSSGIIGIPWPWDILNQSTQGILGGEYYVFYGTSGAMKTWLIMSILAHIYQKTDSRILIYISEMTRKQIVLRFAMLLAALDTQKFKKGLLSPEEETRMRQCMENIHQGVATDPKRARMILLGKEDHIGPQELRAKIRKWGAKVVFADSSYLMSDDRSKSRSTNNQNVSNISGDLRDIALREDLSLFTTTQESERAAKQYGPGGTASMAYSAQFARDADLLCHVLKFLDNGKPELGLEWPKAREYEVPAFTVNAIPATDFSFKKRGVRSASQQQSQDSVIDMSAVGRPMSAQAAVERMYRVVNTFDAPEPIGVA